MKWQQETFEFWEGTKSLRRYDLWVFRIPRLRLLCIRATVAQLGRLNLVNRQPPLCEYHQVCLIPGDPLPYSMYGYAAFFNAMDGTAPSANAQWNSNSAAANIERLENHRIAFICDNFFPQIRRDLEPHREVFCLIHLVRPASKLDQMMAVYQLDVGKVLDHSALFGLLGRHQTRSKGRLRRS